MNQFTAYSARQTQKFAAQLATKLLKAKSSKLKAIVVGLVGDLGSGKTTFIQGFAKTLGIKRHLTSPTFLIIRSYTLNAKPYTLYPIP